jgi:hypothetical protein
MADGSAGAELPLEKVPMAPMATVAPMAPMATGLNRGVLEMRGRTVAVDFETFYDSKAKYSLRNMTPHAYVNDPRFDPYLVSIVSELGEEFVGRPEEFHWGSLDGALLPGHNATFDGMVLNRLIELGRVPEFRRTWVDTADMAAYFNRPRSLKDAAHYLLGIEMCKAVRAGMDGRTFSDAIAAGDGAALLDYAADDARITLKLWTTYGKMWPAVEREISANFRNSNWRGVRVDRAALDAGIKALTAVRRDAEALMPWVDPEDPKDRKPAGSTHALALYARSLGIEVPDSFAKDCPDMQAWVEKYAAVYPVINARLRHASVTTHLARLESMMEMLDKEDNIRFSLVCHGAHTGRSTAGVKHDGEEGPKSDNTPKFNILNVTGDPAKTFGVDMKGLLIPRPGYVFGSWDFGQIEARVIQWLSGNVKFLSLVESVGNIYEADAVSNGLWDPAGGKLKKKNHDLYQVSKRKILSLGFGMGAVKFLADCRKSGVTLQPLAWTPDDLTKGQKIMIRGGAKIDWKDPRNYEEVGLLLRADQIVKGWRAANPEVLAYWDGCQRTMEKAAGDQLNICSYELRSGRVKRYFNPRVERAPKVYVDPETGEESTRIEAQLTASTVEGSRKPFYLYGGKIAQNITQATARDIMFQGAMDVVRETGWAFMFDVYDSVQFEIPEIDADRAAKLVPQCLCEGSHRSWTKGLPLSVEACNESVGGNGITLKYM